MAPCRGQRGRWLWRLTAEARPLALGDVRKLDFGRTRYSVNLFLPYESYFLCNLAYIYKNYV